MMVISVVVNTVDVVKDGVGGVTPGADVTIDVLVEGIDATGVLAGVVTTLGDDVVKTLLGVEARVVEGLVAAGVLDVTGLLVATEGGVLEKTDDEVDVSTLLVGVFVGNVEAGVEAD